MNQQLSNAFNAMRDAAQKSAHKRQALRFWTQRSLYAAFNALRSGFCACVSAAPIACFKEHLL